MKCLYKGTNADFKISLYVCVQKQYPEHFAFLIKVTLEILTREVCDFLKK